LKLQRERLKSIEVRREAVDDFEKYIDVRENSIAKDFANAFAIFTELFSHCKNK